MSEHIITLHGRIFLHTDIELVTGMHIGGAAGGLEIGGVDKPVIRNPLSREPYIPGSSLKGKMRSLMEKAHGAPQNRSINTIWMHLAASEEEYVKYPISRVFGTLPENDGFATRTPTRLTVRDTCLTEESRKKLNAMKTDLPFSEIKWEAAIDRVTSAATPRQIERVPAGAVFGPAELIFSVYTGDGETSSDVAGLFRHVIEALDLLQDDYLGGMGSRGNGQVRLKNLKISARKIDAGKYAEAQDFEPAADLSAVDRAQLDTWLRQQFPA
jgi:CRISPR-associated protein Csm3